MSVTNVFIIQILLTLVKDLPASSTYLRGTYGLQFIPRVFS